jgi:hypothetical protein
MMNYWELYGKIQDRERQDSLLNLELCPWGKGIALVPSVITYALSLQTTTERWRVCSIWNFSLEAWGKGIILVRCIITHTLSLFILIFYFLFLCIAFWDWSATGHSRVEQLAPPSKVHWQRGRRSSTCTLGYWVWNPGWVCDPRRACQWAITTGVFVSTVEILTLYSHSFVNREVFHCSFTFFYSFSLS